MNYLTSRGVGHAKHCWKWRPKAKCVGTRSNQGFERPRLQVLPTREPPKPSTLARSAFIIRRSTMAIRIARRCTLKIAALSAAAFLACGCAARKPLPPPSVYPPIPETAVKQLSHLPSVPYDKLETVTIESEAGSQYLSALNGARQAAAREGGNAMILLEDTAFQQRINGQKRTVRRTVFLVVHLR